jgi:hypothetical protein
MQESLAAEAKHISPKQASEVLKGWFENNTVTKFVYLSGTSAIPFFWQDPSAAHQAVAILTAPENETVERLVCGPEDAQGKICAAFVKVRGKGETQIKEQYARFVQSLRANKVEVKQLPIGLQAGYAYAEFTTPQQADRSEMIIFAPTIAVDLEGEPDKLVTALTAGPLIYRTSNEVIIRLALAITAWSELAN